MCPLCICGILLLDIMKMRLEIAFGIYERVIYLVKKKKQNQIIINYHNSSKVQCSKCKCRRDFVKHTEKSWWPEL